MEQVYTFLSDKCWDETSPSRIQFHRIKSMPKQFSSEPWKTLMIAIVWPWAHFDCVLLNQNSRSKQREKNYTETKRYRKEKKKNGSMGGKKRVTTDQVITVFYSESDWWTYGFNFLNQWHVATKLNQSSPTLLWDRFKNCYNFNCDWFKRKKKKKEKRENKENPHLLKESDVKPNPTWD